MNKKSILMNILLWCEMIVSARLLMFTLPVLISKYTKGTFVMMNASDWTLFTLTIIGLFYFCTGLASVIGFKGWKFFHYLGVVLTLALSFSLVKKVSSLEAGVSFAYYIPILFSIIFALIVALSKGTNVKAAQ